MGVIVREKKKGSGEWWVFINHKGKRRSQKVGSKKAANDVKWGVEARLAKGDNPVDVSNQLGHASTKTTYDFYTNWIPQEDYIHQVDGLDTLHLSAPPPHPTTEKAHGYY